MATTMKYVTATRDWTLVTSTTAMIQFGERCTMHLGGDTAPTDKDGFTMGQNEKYVNNGLINVWARGLDRNGCPIVVCEITE